MPQEPQVVIKVRDNGPYKVAGPVVLIDIHGNRFEVPGGPIVRCRCGQSRDEPFRDSSHKGAGFSSCPRAAGENP